MQHLFDNSDSYNGNTRQTKPENLLKIIEFDDNRGGGIQDNRHATAASFEHSFRDSTPFQCEGNRNNRSLEDQTEQLSYSPPTPPHTPQKNQQNPALSQGNLKRQETDTAHLNLPTFQQINAHTKRLSPLSVSVDQTWVPVSPRVPDSRQYMPPGVISQPPPSPSVRVSFQFDDGLDPSQIEKKRDLLAKAVNDILFQTGDENTGDTIQKPFPLQAPPKSKLKRQLSTDSNDSVENKPLVKSPTKRQSVNNVSGSTIHIDRDHPGYYNHNENFNRSSRFNPERINEIPQNSGLGGNIVERKSNVENSKQTIPSTPAYAHNIKWVLEKQSPTSEEDFKHVHTEYNGQEHNKLQKSDSSNTRNHGSIQTSLSASHILSPKFNYDAKSSLRQTLSCANLDSKCFSHGTCQPNFENLNRRMSCGSKKEDNIESLNKEMVSNYNQRDERAEDSTATFSSKSNPLVTEKGFVFPQRANITNPVPFSPRIVHQEISPCKMNSELRRDSSMINSQNICTPLNQDTNSIQAGKHQDNSTFVPDRDLYGLTYNNTELKRVLRSKSSIEGSPSKKEIEEMREYVRQMRRYMSCPLESPQHEKNMLIEERILHSLQNNENVHQKMMQSPSNYHADTAECLSPSSLAYRGRCSHCDIHHERRELRANVSNDVKRQLFSSGCGKQPFQVGNQRNFSPKTENVIPDTIASILSSRNMLTRDEIQTINNYRNSNRNNLPTDNNQSDLRYNNASSTDAGIRKTNNFNRLEDFRDRFTVEENLHDHPGQRYGRCQTSSLFSRNTTTSDGSYEQFYSPLPNCGQKSGKSPEKDSNRRRKTGNIDLCVSCEEFPEKNHHLQEHFRQFQHSGKNCICANVENEILLMAREAYKKIRRADESSQALEQFENEVQVTNNSIYDAMEILCSIKCLCKYGRTIEDIYSGSIIFTINCPTLKSLDDLWSRFTSREIEEILNDDFSVLIKKHSEDIHLNVHISADEYMQCRRELELMESVTPLDTSLANSTLSNNSMSKSDTELCSIASSKENNPTLEYRKMTSLAVIHTRCHSAPITRTPTPVSSPSWLTKSPKSPMNRERIFSFSMNTERKAFQELNIGKDVPCSPTMKKLFEFDITLSPKTSPKRKNFAESPPWEHENMHPELVSPKRKNCGNIFSFRNENK